MKTGLYIYDNTSLSSPQDEKYFRQKLYRNQNTHFMSSNVLCKSWRLTDNEENYGRGGQATDDNIIQRIHTVPWITKDTETQKNM